MTKHRTYSIEFKRQVAQEYIAGDIIHHTPLTNKARFSFNFPYRELRSPGKSLPPPAFRERRHRRLAVVHTT